MVKEETKKEIEVLTHSMLTYDQQFLVIGRRNLDLLIKFEDILIKLLDYIKYWE